MSTMPLLIDSDAVAPGDGAFRTCIALPVTVMRKSSTSAPVRSTACARTPAPPSPRCRRSTSGTSRCSDRVNAPLLNER